MRRKTKRTVIAVASAICIAPHICTAHAYGNSLQETCIEDDEDAKAVSTCNDCFLEDTLHEPTLGSTADDIYMNAACRFSFSEKDAEILKTLAMAEAEGEGTEGKALVMLVVLNRVSSSEFPDSIEDVVFQKTGNAYQFSSVANGGRYWSSKPDSECSDALELVTKGWDGSQGALFFESCSGSSWHSRNLKSLFEHGKHRFYL